ncbi:hypothetical protein DBY21_00465 [Candidatus Gastranaerophilales bacterium]|nr:MAG: hypothetical protein DBY21_00465 [Candidatus Gastranaerophilales bacterium]
MQEKLVENKILFQKELGKLVKERRLELKKSISLISAEIGMTKSMWADLEKGIKDPQLSTLWRVCEGLEIEPSDILKELKVKLDMNFTFVE